MTRRKRRNHSSAFKVHFLRSQSTTLRDTLKGAARIDYDQALDLVERGLDTLPAKVRSVALFARGRGGGQFFLAVPLRAPVLNQMTVYPVPDMGQLLSIRESQGHHLLVLVRRRWIQAADLDANTEPLLLWSTLSSASGAGEGIVESKAFGSARFRVELQRPLGEIERLMRIRKKEPVILAGEAELTEPLRAALPRSWRARVIETLPVGEHKTYPAVVAASREVFARYEEERSKELVSRLMRGVRGSRYAVAGVVASLQALQDNEVETLILVNDIDQVTSRIDYGCNESKVRLQPPKLGSSNADKPVRLHDPRIELLRLAIRQGVAIDIVHSDPALNYLGGVGCLLRQHAEVHAEPLPKGGAGLRLVA